MTEHLKHRLEVDPNVTADTYKPVFRHNVATTQANGETTPVNPVYCLSDKSAGELASILGDLQPEIEQATPTAFREGGGVSVNHLVPWLKFPSGLMVNAGLEANYWVNASSGASAESNCRKDIAAAERQFEAEGGGQQP